jgi:hypothetical protein
MTTKRVAMGLLAVIVVGVLGWLAFLVYAEQPGAGEEGMATDHSEHAELLAAPKQASNGQARLMVTIDPQEGAEVGDLMSFTAKVTDTAGSPITNVKYTIVQWHTEDEKVIFGTTGVSPDGTLAWTFNAHDGIPYEIRVNAEPTAQSSIQFAPLNVAPGAVVDPLAPPLRVKLLNTFYLVAVVGVGLMLGLWLANRRAAMAERRRTTRRVMAAPTGAAR